MTDHKTASTFSFALHSTNHSSAPLSPGDRQRVVSRIFRKHCWTRWMLAGVLLCGSSCSSASKYVQRTFQRDAHEQVAEAEQKKGEEKATLRTATVTEAADKKNESKPATPDAANANIAARPASTDPQTPRPDVRELIAKGKDPFGDSSIRQASNEQPAPMPEQKSADTISHPAHPREELNAQLASAAVASPPAQSCPPTAPCAARPFPGPEVVGDEFICDGGDKGEPVHYEGKNRAGLGLEDTVAEFKDETGKIHMKPSTEACVYAPRFGSVSSATLPEEELQVAKAAGHQDQSAVGGLNTRTVIDEETQTDEPQGMLMRSRASGINNRQGEDQLSKAQSAKNQVKLVNAYEDFRFLREGQFDRASNAVIGQGVDAAQEWADGRRPIIVAKDEGGQIVQGRFTAQDYTGVEDKRTPGELQLVKVADRASAHPGEVVTFTIRFDNVGGRELSSVRVVDNLSPRLDYIENSISSNLAGKVDVSDNGFGGKLLTFEFDQPLQGKTGGYVSFQCRVR